MAFLNSCNCNSSRLQLNSSNHKFETLDEIKEEEECDYEEETNIKVEPGKGLLAYLNRLSTFCKRTNRDGTFTQEALKEFPKSVTVFPEEKPRDHKLSFVDDIPYVTTMKPYMPKFFNCDDEVISEDEEKPEPWIETCTSQNCTPNCCNCGLQSYNLKRRCKIFNCTREALSVERFKCEDYGTVDSPPQHEFTFVRSELPSWIKKKNNQDSGNI